MRALSSSLCVSLLIPYDTDKSNDIDLLKGENERLRQDKARLQQTINELKAQLAALNVAAP